MTRILALGECMVEMAPTPVAGQFRRGFAGDTLNTAWYLRHLVGEDDQVGYFTAVGRDPLSDQMLAFLSDHDIDTQHILRRVDRTMGLYLIQLDNGERSFSYWRSDSAARTMLSETAPLATALNNCQVAYLSGISLAILPTVDRARLLNTLGRFRRDGGQVIFDPNLRPRLWSSPQEMTATIMQAATVSDTILPSFDDEAEFFGDANPDATAARYGGAGANCVVVKNGPGKIVTVEQSTRLAFQPPEVAEVVDSTAAGDSFNAAFIAARLAGAGMAEAVGAGISIAAQVISAFGALVPVAPPAQAGPAPSALP